MFFYLFFTVMYAVFMKITIFVACYFAIVLCELMQNNILTNELSKRCLKEMKISVV